MDDELSAGIDGFLSLFACVSHRADANAGAPRGAKGVIEGRAHFGVSSLPAVAEGKGQITRTNEEQVDTRDLADARQIFDRVGVLDHRHDDGLVVGPPKILRGGSTQAMRIGAGRTSRPPGSGRVVLHRIDGCLRIAGRTHVRNDHPGRARLEVRQHYHGIIPWHPNQDGKVDGIGGTDHVAARLDTQDPVLGIDEGEVKAEQAADLDKIGRWLSGNDPDEKVAGADASAQHPAQQLLRLPFPAWRVRRVVPD